MSKADVTVIGAGIVGARAALELAKEGASVRLIDWGSPPSPLAASTDISKLIRADYGSDAFYTSLLLEGLADFEAMNVGQARPIFHATGLLVLAGPSGLARGTFEGDSYETLRSMGLSATALGPREIADRFPAWSGVQAGYVSHVGGYAESGRAVAWTVDAARAAGVSVLCSEVECVGERFQTVLGEPIDSEVIVVACGALTGRLLPELGGFLRPIAQSIVHLGGPSTVRLVPPEFLPWACDIARSGWYGFPTQDGVLKIGHHGAGRPGDPVSERDPDLRHDRAVRAFAAAHLPSVAEAEIAERRVCYYSDTPDGDFLIDRHPERPGVIVAAGGSGHAFKFGPELGREVARLALGKPGRFAHRFGFRTPKSGAREASRALAMGDS